MNRLKRLLFIASLGTTLYFTGCNTRNTNEQNAIINSMWQQPDTHSYANLSEIRTKHLHLDLDVNFENRTLYGVARHQMDTHHAQRAIFDVKHLDIQRITTGKNKEVSVDYQLGKMNELLGRPLIVSIDSSVEYINIYYKTTDKTEALDWLSAEITQGKQHPMVYSQGQTLLTRTWIPIQDSPSNRLTYSATVKTPDDLIALMSATNPIEKDTSGVYHFSMSQPIPSYLIALAVGNFEYRKLGDYCGVYSEPELIEDCADEFVDLPNLLQAAQMLYGAYRWEQYDVLVLPYSFPFGGMENPRLTFAHPTLITGDRSLVSVIAHELAHSWSGNLVTNASWNDFWLNEGFTVYFENRIMEELYGKEHATILKVLEMQELQQTLQRINEQETHLKQQLTNRNPDEAMTDIAYIKGAYLLRTIETIIGRPIFDTFLRTYFDQHAFQTLTTEDFVRYITTHLFIPNQLEFNINEWIYGAGLPSNCVEVVSDRLQEIAQIAQKAVKNVHTLNKQTTQRWTTQEWIAFIRAIPTTTSADILQQLDAHTSLKNSQNAEILCQWYVLAIQCGYTEIYDDIAHFISKVGRLKYLEPIYETLASSSEQNNKKWIRQQFQQFKTNYHPLTTQAIERILIEHLI